MENFNKFLRWFFRQKSNRNPNKRILSLPPIKPQIAIPYEELEKHFKAPKIISPFYNVKRVPRKFKKKWKKVFQDYKNQDLNTILWIILGMENKNYRTFLIKKMCEN